MSGSEEKSALDKAYEEYERWRNEIFFLVSENPEIFDRYFQATRKYNDALEEYRGQLRETGEKGKFGKLSVRVSNTTSYDVGVLTKEAPHVLAIPGVVGSVRKAGVEKAVSKGMLERQIAERAKKMAAKVSVIGPKEIEVDL